jgi:hypothetical protein
MMQGRRRHSLLCSGHSVACFNSPTIHNGCIVDYTFRWQTGICNPKHIKTHPLTCQACYFSKYVRSHSKAESQLPVTAAAR